MAKNVCNCNSRNEKFVRNKKTETIDHALVFLVLKNLLLVNESKS